MKQNIKIDNRYARECERSKQFDNELIVSCMLVYNVHCFCCRITHLIHGSNILLSFWLYSSIQITHADWLSPVSIALHIYLFSFVVFIEFFHQSKIVIASTVDTIELEKYFCFSPPKKKLMRSIWFPLTLSSVAGGSHISH